jgi:hypothetical protein
VDQINESKYISVICDGCTDTAAIEEEIVSKTAFLSKSEEAYCMQTEHVIRSISLL